MAKFPPIPDFVVDPRDWRDIPEAEAKEFFEMLSKTFATRPDRQRDFALLMKEGERRSLQAQKERKEREHRALLEGKERIEREHRALLEEKERKMLEIGVLLGDEKRKARDLCTLKLKMLNLK